MRRSVNKIYRPKAQPELPQHMNMKPLFSKISADCRAPLKAALNVLFYDNYFVPEIYIF